MPSVGLYHGDFPSQITADSQALFQFHNSQKQQPVIGIAMYGSVVDYEQQQVIDAFISKLEKKGAKAFGYFFDDGGVILTY